ncbi:Crp/Fnr family transcriptional regulator [Paraburkholderia fungorum]|uniref:Crp/Fnr family transcriptional regulator n=1 Tax=Paraburkholderia fungorum TaxID=134537 RepID=UPI0038BB8B8A
MATTIDLNERVIEPSPGPARGLRSVHNQRARGLTRLFHIPFRTVQDQLDRDPNLTASLLRLLAVRARDLFDRLGKLGLMSFRARLAYQLIALGERYGQPDRDGLSLGIRLSQEDLAALLMASRQHVNKELRWLIDQHIVRVRYGRITLLDIDRLRSISDGKVHTLVSQVPLHRPHPPSC